MQRAIFVRSMDKLIKDFSSSIVVFLVALPLCLGIAHASGVPAMSGLIAGIVGGLVVGTISGSHISVSGPAAGLITLVIASQSELKSMAHDNVNIIAVLGAAVFIAGLMQFLFGTLRLGKIADFIPVSVIKGMLAAIGILLILKQLPHIVGWDMDDFGDEDFVQQDGQNTFSELRMAFSHITPLATVIGVLGILIQVVWELQFLKNYKFIKWFPAPLIVVFVGVLINNHTANDLKIMGPNHLVTLPEIELWGSQSLINNFIRPDFSFLGKTVFWIIALKVAIIASLESLLSLEASDKLDLHKRISPVNRELHAQGIGNMISGILGGLPITAVVVRSSANSSAGAETKRSAIFHGFWLLLAVIAFSKYLNQIPNSALAAVLIFVGYKLVKPSLFKSEYHRGMGAFIPFVITIMAILMTDLLVGIAVGMIVGFYFVIKTNFHRSITLVSLGNTFLIRFYYQATFLNKSILKDKLSQLPHGSEVILDFTNCHFVDNDIRDILSDFEITAREKNLVVTHKFTSDSHRVRLMKPSTS